MILVKVARQSNVSKEEVSTFSFDEAKGSLHSEISSRFSDLELIHDFNNVWVVEDGIASKLIPDYHVHCDEVEVIITSIVAPSNAYEFKRFEGISFVFHTDEMKHINDPHVHARYNGEEMRIRLGDFSHKGHFRNKKKMNAALEYVKSNIEAFHDEWHRLIRSYNLEVSPLG